MSLTTNCGIKLLLINMVENEFRDIAKHRALEIYAEETAVEGTGLYLHQNDQVYSRPAFPLGFFFSTAMLLTSRAKVGPQSLVTFAEYKVTFFVSVISKEHNITISKVSESLIPVGDIFSFKNSIF